MSFSDMTTRPSDHNQKKSDTPRMDNIPRRAAFHHYREEDIFEEGRKLERELQAARKARDLAEAKSRWIEGVKSCKDAQELAAKLPPDILMGPLPFPDRIDYAAKIIQHAFEQWTAKEGYLAALQAAEERAQKAEAEVADLQAGFDLRWKADMRAINRWREATGRINVLPDHADLCVWLLEQSAMQAGGISELRPKLTRECEANDSKEAELADLRARLAAREMELETAGRMADLGRQSAGALLTERDQSRANEARLRAALEKLEWVEDQHLGPQHATCPWCHAWQMHGHASDCGLAAALAATPAEPAGEVPDNCPKCGVHIKTGRLHMSGCDWKPAISPATTAGGDWSESLPNEQGLWWHWTGDEDTTAYPVTILYSGTSDSYFAPAGQWGWTQFQPVEDMGGWWMRCVEPPLPGQQPTQPEGDGAKDGALLQKLVDALDPAKDPPRNLPETIAKAKQRIAAMAKTEEGLDKTQTIG